MSDIQTFHAESLPKALQKVKATLGANAIILGTRTIEPGALGGILGKKTVEIVAQPSAPTSATFAHRKNENKIDDTSRATRSHVAARTNHARLGVAYAPYSFATPKSTLHSQQPSGLTPSASVRSRPPQSARQSSSLVLRRAYETLVQNEVADELAKKLLIQVRQKLLTTSCTAEELVRAELAEMIPTCRGIAIPADASRTVCLVGPPGVGKTTTVAKLAAHFKLREKRRVAVLAADFHRLGAADQMGRYGDLIRVPVERVRTPAEVAAARTRLLQEGYELILIDTPGVGRADAQRMEDLSTLVGAAAADEIHLVLPVTLEARVRDRTAALFAPLGVSRVVLTHVDDALGFGVVANAMATLRWKLAYVCSGQNVPSDFQSACGEEVAHLIFPVNAVGASRGAFVTQEA
ncbi:MAG: flagellar biosynthesis protein FlhF [Phycisphaerae bacterium]